MVIRDISCVRGEAQIHYARQRHFRYREACLPLVPLLMLYLKLQRTHIHQLRCYSGYDAKRSHLQEVVFEVCQLALGSHFCSAEVDLALQVDVSRARLVEVPKCSDLPSTCLPLGLLHPCCYRMFSCRRSASPLSMETSTGEIGLLDRRLRRNKSEPETY